MSIPDRHRRVVYGILKHLQKQLEQGVVQGENAEGVGIAVQCLSAAYGVELTAHQSQYDVKESLEEMFSKAAPVSSVEKAEALKGQGNTYLKLNKFQEAVDCYSKAIDLDPSNATYFCNRAAAYIKLQKLDEGLEDCKRAVFLNPSYARAYGRLGYIYSSQHKLEESRDSFMKAIELDPDNENYKTNLHTVEEQLAAAGPGAGTTSGDSSQGAQPGAGGIPNIGIPGFGNLLSNPSFMNMATNLMQSPAFQNFASQMMSAGAGQAAPPQQGSQQPQQQGQSSQEGQQGGQQGGQGGQQGEQGGQQGQQGQQGGQPGGQGGQQGQQGGQPGGVPGGFPGGMPDLGAMAGMMPNLFQMAQNMQQTNPQLFESLRQQFPGAGTGPGTGTGTGAPPQPKPDGQ